MSDDLSLLWRLGKFNEAQTVLDAELAQGQSSLEFVRAAAEAAYELHDYGRAAQLYAAIAETVKADPVEHLDAKRRQWLSLREQDETGIGPWVPAARAEVQDALVNTLGRPGRERQLALELEHTLSEITDGPQAPGAELRQNYGDSILVLRAAKQMVNTISTVNDPQKRIGLAQRFLLDYPGSYWRHLAYRSWLHAAWQQSDTPQLDAVAQKYLAEYPGAPQSQGAVSWYFMEAGHQLERGQQLAEAAVAAYERILGIDGTAAGIQRLDRETRADGPRPDELPPRGREVLMEYLGSRFNLGRYYLASKSNAAALRQVEPVLDAQPYTLDDEESTAQFDYLAGLIYEAQGRDAEARKHFWAAASAGDSRQRYALAAQAKLGPEARERIPASMLPASIRNVPLPVFADVTKAAKLQGAQGQRVAWADVNSDQFADFVLDGNGLYVADRARGFKDGGSFSASGRQHSGGAWGDYDNDGDLDLYSYGAGRGGDALYRNDDGAFADATATAGDPTDSYPSEAAAWLDYDNDGWLDLYVGNYEAGNRADEDERNDAAPSVLYRNTGDGLRRVPRSEAGLEPPFGVELPAKGLSPADINGDGWNDLFVGNYRLRENLAWVNDGGRFTNHARLLGVAGSNKDGHWGHTLGSAWGDIDNDGDLDLFSCNLAHQRYSYISDRSQLLINGAGEHTLFADERARRGIKYSETNTDPVLADFNSDGYLDLFFTSNFAGRPSYLYLNDGHGSFADVTFLAGARYANCYGCAVADYDVDGDVDLLLASADGVRLLENRSPQQQWMAVRLLSGAVDGGPAPEGRPWSNSLCMGARVLVRSASGGDLIMRELQSTRGVGSGDQQLLYFGLGDRTGPLTVEVRYPSGRKWTTRVTELGGTYTFHEKDAVFGAEDTAPVESSQPQRAAPPSRDRGRN